MKLNYDRNSLKARFVKNFLIFAVVIMVFLWGLQVLFLNTFYQSMKETATDKLMRNIENAYDEFDTEQFLTAISDLEDNNDIFIYVSLPDGTPFFISNTEMSSISYGSNIETVYQQMVKEGADSVSLLIKENIETGQKTLAYGKLLTAKGKTPFIVYVISPLWPMQSTIEILTTMLLWVTLLALVLAAFLALYISNRIATPIRNITNSANKLAHGEYGIVFHGGHYTEVDELANTLTRASIELEKSASLQKDLIANVSHDLKTPLTMVKSYAEMIRDLSGDNPKKREKHLQVIIEEADRLNLLVSDMLTLSKMQSGAIVIDRTDFDLFEELNGILLSYKLLKEEDGYIINFTCPENVMVNGDPERIKQVMANLINNALKFCGDDKTINVAITPKGNRVLCQVQDFGVGIPAEELPHIWERYYKSSSNMVRTTTGSGLGLSIVKEILSLHNVRYGVDSTLGEGTTFWFELDAVKSQN